VRIHLGWWDVVACHTHETANKVGGKLPLFFCRRVVSHPSQVDLSRNDRVDPHESVKLGCEGGNVSRETM
jgi:hypothetical protein